MSEVQPRHLVMVRHGESEGDVRRAARKTGKLYPSPKDTAREPQTEQGHRQSRLAGKWITKYIMEAYGITQFDLMLTSPTVRTKQSASSLGVRGAWKDEPLLKERNRGSVQGMTRRMHETLYPDSFRQMAEDPLHWTPPEGESILDVADKAREFRDQVQSIGSVLCMTHRDWIWAAQMALEGLSELELLAVNTDEIENARIVHYTNINPYDGTLDESLSWKRSVCPWAHEQESTQAPNDWVSLQNKDSLFA